MTALWPIGVLEPVGSALRATATGFGSVAPCAARRWRGGPKRSIPVCSGPARMVEDGSGAAPPDAGAAMAADARLPVPSGAPAASSSCAKVRAEAFEASLFRLDRRRKRPCQSGVFARTLRSRDDCTDASSTMLMASLPLRKRDRPERVLLTVQFPEIERPAKVLSMISPDPPFGESRSLSYLLRRMRFAFALRPACSEWPCTKTRAFFEEGQLWDDHARE